MCEGGESVCGLFGKLLVVQREMQKKHPFKKHARPLSLSSPSKNSVLCCSSRLQPKGGKGK